MLFQYYIFVYFILVSRNISIFGITISVLHICVLIFIISVKKY